MNSITLLYHEAIYRPLLNGLVFIYATLPVHDLGLAIIVLTLLVRIILHPSLVQTIRTQRVMTRLQPKLREVQETHKDNREEQARQTMALYREAGVHPLSGCLPLLIQIPILIGLYQVFLRGIALGDPTLLYPAIPPIASFNPVAFGIFNLAEKSIFLAIAAGVSQLLYSRFLGRVTTPAGSGSALDFSRALQWQTTYILPVIIVAISWSLPSALSFYWTVLNLLAIVQQLLIEKRLRHELDSGSRDRDAHQNGHHR